MGKTQFPSHDNAIRARLLNRLGIYKNLPIRNSVDSQRRKHVIRSIGNTHQLALSSVSGQHGHVIGNQGPFQEPLKQGNCEGSFRPPSRIQFNSNVTVVPIPSRHQYSNRIKRFLWSDSREIRENAERNIREYEFEGWDWHMVLEDEEMFLDSQTGELVHPCWFEEDQTTDMDDSESEYLEVKQPLTRSQSCVVGLDELSD